MRDKREKEELTASSPEKKTHCDFDLGKCTEKGLMKVKAVRRRDRRRACEDISGVQNNAQRRGQDASG